MIKPKKPNKIQSIVFLCIALVVIGYWVNKKIPWEEKTIDLGYTMKARMNPFLAAEIYLKQAGISVTSYRGLAKLDELSDSQETLIITSWRLSMSKNQIHALLEWVKNGGHLITTAQSYYDEEKAGSADELLDQIGVHMYPNEEDGSPLTVVTPVKFKGVNNPVSINLSTASNLVDFNQQASAWAEGDYGVGLLQFQINDGTVTVLTDDTFLQNANIGNHDHAYFLWLITRNRGSVWLLHGGKTPSLLALTWKYASALVISTFVLLALWLWRRAYRFGPILSNPPLARRQLMEHIMANGTFLWRHNEMRRLIKNIQDDIDRKMQLHHRNYRGLSMSNKQLLIQESTQIPGSEVVWTWAMCSSINDYRPGSKKDAYFVRLIKNLQKIRNQL